LVEREDEWMIGKEHPDVKAKVTEDVWGLMKFVFLWVW
jgi:hypothetical protein